MNGALRDPAFSWEAKQSSGEENAVCVRGCIMGGPVLAAAFEPGRLASEPTHCFKQGTTVLQEDGLHKLLDTILSWC